MMKRLRMNFVKPTDWHALVLLSLWSVVSLMLLSSDSPLHGDWDRLDSAIFFTSGKAMMNGLQPYVDFADSKGPLLWLIYGVGYLLTPRSYVGVFWLSCVCYAAILYYNYLTARLFLGDRLRSYAVAIVMPFFYFQYWFHDDVRAEDFCTLPVSVSLYYVFLLLTDGGRQVKGRPPGCAMLPQPSPRTIGLVLGACFSALVLIKFSIALMQGTMIVVVLCYYMFVDYQAPKVLKYLVVGALAFSLPFIVYLVQQDSLGAFIDEYFRNTLATVTPDDGVRGKYSEEIAQALGSPKRLALFVALLSGGWLASRQLTRYRWVPLLLCVVFFMACTRHYMAYYHSACCVLLLFLVINVLTQSQGLNRFHAVILCACMLGWGYYENVRPKSHLAKLWLTGDHQHRHEHYQYLSGFIKGYKPKILYFYGADFGYGLASEALPACRYWTFQYGSTPEMEAAHVQSLKEGIADYVIVSDRLRARRHGFRKKNFRELGYHLLGSASYRPLFGERLIADIYEHNRLTNSKTSDDYETTKSAAQ